MLFNEFEEISGFEQELFEVNNIKADVTNRGTLCTCNGDDVRMSILLKFQRIFCE